MDRVITIDGKEVGFRATALTPRLYRHRMGRDVVQDLNRLRRSYGKALAGVPELVVPENATDEEKAELTQLHEQAVQDAQLSATDLEIFENIAFVTARQYAPDKVPDNPEEWLDTFQTFSIYEILPTILELWQLNQHTTSTTKNQ